MSPSYTPSYQNILSVENWGSQLSTLFKIMSPVQITLEACTGLSAEDHYRIEMYAPSGCWKHESQNDAMFRSLNTRPPHRHDYFELLIVLQGEIIQQIEDKEYLYRAGTCCLINRSILHTERFTCPAAICFVGLSVDLIQTLLAEAPHQLFEAARHPEQNPVMQFMLANLGSEIRKEYQDLFPTPENTTSTAALSALLERMTQTLSRPDAAAGYYIKGLLCELFQTLGSGFYATPVHLSASPENLLFLRISRLLQDTNGRLTRSELARILSYNGSYLNAIVQRRTGMCLFDYGMTFCFQKAELLLKETSLSVSQIAAELKFTNRTHFYALFRKHYGMTPQQWRKQFCDSKESP